MHVDATLVRAGDGALCQFEIDGSAHFMQRPGELRRDEDEVKDDLMRVAKQGLLRMHYQDSPRFLHYIGLCFDRLPTTVKYTAFYLSSNVVDCEKDVLQ